jgi:CDP-glucose 4,6-dehydratase
VIGGGDWARDRIVTDIVRALSAGEPVRVRNPQAVRPWQHVLEPLSGYLALAARMLESDEPRWCSAWNFGPQFGQEASVAELVDLFIATWGSGSWEDTHDPRQPHESGILRLRIDKAMRELDWTPQWGLAESVRRTAAWYRTFAAQDGSMRAACEEDLRDYEEQMAPAASPS